jgi:hypothetical protein
LRNRKEPPCSWSGHGDGVVSHSDYLDASNCIWPNVLSPS